MHAILRWTARLASIAIAIAFALFWFSDPPRIGELSVGIRWQLVAMTTGVLGLLVGLWRERLGGALAIAGFAGFLALEGSHLHTFPVIPAVYVMALPALLYLIVGARRPTDAHLPGAAQ